MPWDGVVCRGVGWGGGGGALSAPGSGAKARTIEEK